LPELHRADFVLFFEGIMDMWWKGLILGFSIAAPLGPIGLLCIKRTLEGGRLRGMLSGLGAASADAFYGSLAAFGLAELFQRYSWIQTWTQILGSAFIVYLGIRYVLSKKTENNGEAEVRAAGMGKVYLTTFLLTLLNPIAIFAFIGIFAGAGVRSTGSAIWVVAGIFCGSMLWWIVLAFIAHWLGKRLSAAFLLWVNRIAGIALIGFGLWFAVSAILNM
jgi:threonine/homoserine/homoserine lactone efflux protein